MNFDEDLQSTNRDRLFSSPPVASCFQRFFKHIASLATGLLLLMPCFSYALGSMAQSDCFPWSVTASLGYAKYQNMYKGDGQTALGRLAIGWDFIIFDQGTIGAELGVQNGNNMRLSVPQPLLDSIGGVPIQSNFKPVLDILLVLKSATWGETPAYGMVKLGGAYRRWNFENGDCINDLAKLAGEVQIGFGYTIARRASISLSYQAILGGDPDFKIDEITFKPRVSNIPAQHALLLGLTITV